MKKARQYKHRRRRLLPLGLSEEHKDAIARQAMFAVATNGSMVTLRKNDAGVVVIRIDVDIIGHRVMVTENIMRRIRWYEINMKKSTIRRFRVTNMKDVKLINKVRL